MRAPVCFAVAALLLCFFPLSDRHKHSITGLLADFCSDLLAQP